MVNKVIRWNPFMIVIMWILVSSSLLLFCFTVMGCWYCVRSFTVSEKYDFLLWLNAWRGPDTPERPVFSINLVNYRPCCCGFAASRRGSLVLSRQSINKKKLITFGTWDTLINLKRLHKVAISPVIHLETFCPKNSLFQSVSIVLYVFYQPFVENLILHFPS